MPDNVPVFADRVSDDDLVWYSEVKQGELLKILHDPHTWVSSNIKMRSGEAAVLNDDFVIVFQDLQPASGGASEKENESNILVHGIHNTAVLTIRSAPQAVSKEFVKKVFDKPSEALKDFDQFMTDEDLGSGVDFIGGKDWSGFVDSVSETIKRDDEEAKMEVQVIGDRVYGHTQLGKSRANVALHLWTNAVAKEKYFETLDKLIQVPARKGPSAPALAREERMSFKKSPDVDRIYFVFQGRKAPGAPTDELLKEVCNITQGRQVLEGGRKVVHTEMVITKSY